LEGSLEVLLPPIHVRKRGNYGEVRLDGTERDCDVLIGIAAWDLGPAQGGPKRPEALAADGGDAAHDRVSMPFLMKRGERVAHPMPGTKIPMTPILAARHLEAEEHTKGRATIKTSVRMVMADTS
jgi:hypothetical protein